MLGLYIKMEKIQELNDKVGLIANSNLWIEELAVEQLKNTAKLQGMLRVCGMPDLHPARTYPIGAAFFSSETIYPALVGGDIGCGMSLWQTELALRTSPDKLEKKIGNIDRELSAIEVENLLGYTAKTKANGTIGGGNHFAELLQIDSILEIEVAEKLGLVKDKLQLLVHSGSRGFGGEILRNHLSIFDYEPLKANTVEAENYLKNHNLALDYAIENRLLIAKRILNNLKSNGRKIVDITHNFVEYTTIAGQSGFLHRKGAAPSDREFAVIPGSRGSYSYLVATYANDLALNSIAHGAGRKWKRSDCQAKLENKFTSEQLKRTKYKSRVICEDKSLLYEEAPQAYKDIESVIAVLEAVGIIKTIARFIPVLTYKKRAEK